MILLSLEIAYHTDNGIRKRNSQLSAKKVSRLSVRAKALGVHPIVDNLDPRGVNAHRPNIEEFPRVRVCDHYIEK